MEVAPTLRGLSRLSHVGPLSAWKDLGHAGNTSDQIIAGRLLGENERLDVSSGPLRQHVTASLL